MLVGFGWFWLVVSLDTKQANNEFWNLKKRDYAVVSAFRSVHRRIIDCRGDLLLGKVYFKLTQLI